MQAELIKGGQEIDDFRYEDGDWSQDKGEQEVDEVRYVERDQGGWLQNSGGGWRWKVGDDEVDEAWWMDD